jgi:RNA polymerase sigma-70 factor, ECF subfamily
VKANSYFSFTAFSLMTLTEKEVLEGLRNSDEMVFENIFKNYYQRLCSYAHSIIYDLDEAEETVQNTFLILWEKRETIDIHTSMKSYLYQAVHNSCLNRIKHYKVRRKYGEDMKREAEVVFDNASQLLLDKEIEKQMNLAIESLPKQCKAVFKLSRFESLTYAEIAEQLNLSVKTVDNHMVRALKLLRVKLKDYLPLLLWLIFSKN